MPRRTENVSDASTNEQLEAQIEQLKAQLADTERKPKEEALKEGTIRFVDIPESVTGFPVNINGRPVVGRHRIVLSNGAWWINDLSWAPRDEAHPNGGVLLSEVQSMLSNKAAIEKELLMTRGNQLSARQLADADVTSRIIARRPHTVI